jgi:hypothetical protein
MVVMPAATTAPTVLNYGANTTDKTDCGSGATIDNLGAGDMSVFVRLKRNTTGNNQYFISKYNGGATGWAMSLDDTVATGDISVNFGRSGTDGLVLSANSSRIAVGTWYDVGFSWADADATREIRIYQSPVGTALAEVSGYDGGSNQGSGTADADASANLWIGNLQITGVNPVLANIEYVAIFNKVLTAAQMLTLQQGFDRKSTAQITGIGGCVMLHRLNGTGTLTDLTGNANNGTTTGATTTTGIANQFAPAVFGVSNDVVDNTDYYYTNSHAEVSYVTTATSVTAGIVRTLEATYDEQAAIAVYEDGVYKGQILAPAVGKSYGTLALTAGSKTVTFRNGVRSNPSAGANEGTFVASLLFNASATEVVPTTYAPSRTIVIMPDSISDGFTTNSVGQYGLINQFRAYARGIGYDVICEGGGGWQAYDYASDATARTNSAALIGKYSSEIVVIELGTNDSNRGDWTSTNFGIGYAAWLVAINGENPRAAIKAVTLPRNGGGETGYSTWRTEIINAASGKAYVAVTNGNPDYWDGSDFAADGVHPSNTATTNYILPRLKTVCGI